MNTAAIRGLTSIIIPCWNQLEFTRHCVAALKRFTREPWELIVVDNGSTDQTGTYLAGLQALAAVPVTVVANASNRGFPAAINQGLQVARGEYLVLLNNDVVVTDGWLDQLVALANAQPGRENGSLPMAERSNVTILDFEEEVLKRRTSESPVVSFAETTPPGPPFTRGGKDLAARSGDGSGAVRASCIGLVGPMSNYAAPPQLVEDVPYRDVDDMHHFAQRWRDEHRGQWFTVPKLSGFCLLMKRAVYDKIGGLDERFGLGMFDDDDLAERARRAGFELAVAHDLFVHHFGSRTFAGNGIDAEKLLDENAARFADKWGLNGIFGKRVALTPFVNGESRASYTGSRNPDSRKNGHTGHHDSPAPLLSSVDRASVSLTMIVRDEENNLAACLQSVRGLFDEIVVVDTGSTDRTVEIARSFGARVFDFVWVDDFGAARNAALARATGDYAFWLDADDVIEPPEREKLEFLLGRLRKGEQTAFVVRCSCDPSPDGTGGDTVVDHIRLFPVREDVRWTYRVHEQILPALRRANVSVQWTKLTVRHTGYVDRELRSRKLDRDSRILVQELEERPDDPFTLFNLGSIAIERQDWSGALAFLKQSLANSAPTDSIVRKLFALIARAYQMLGDSEAALQTCQEGLQVDPDDAELWFRKAVVHRHRGESSAAEQCWRRILTLRRPDRFCSVDQGIFGHLTRRNLAALAAERDDRAEAQRLWTEILAECPGDAEAVARLAQAQVAPSGDAQPQRDERSGPWIIPGSRRTIVPLVGPGEFDPYAPVAKAWVEALKATVIVELGVRFGHSTRAFLEGARAVDGRVWGVDPLERHGVSDDRFTFIQADPIQVATRWDRIDLLHVDIDSQCEDDARRWLGEYSSRCRAIAVCHSHHPGYRLGPVIGELAATGGWEVFEYLGNLGGWTVLARHGETCLSD